MGDAVRLPPLPAHVAEHAEDCLLYTSYFDSVGRGANLNLNVPPDRRGRIHEEDKKSLAGFRALLNELYSRN